MANWAIAIGIDRYWRKEACLSGAVRDAQKMAKWLLDPDGGNVPKTNLELLASPLPGKRQPAGSREATKDNITTVVTDLVDRSGAKGERFYFYFAGHGLTVRDNFTYEQAIVASDFDDTLKDKTFALRSLWEFFEATDFEDQFFFIDACRSHWPGELVVGRWASPRTSAPGQDQVQQFRLHATSPGLAAVESTSPGQEEGAFTAALLDALAGKGVAKSWCPNDGDYKVRWARVSDYVRLEFQRRLLPAGAGFQIPQATGKQGVLDREQNPILAAFPAGAFKDERLRVFLKPSSVVSAATVEIVDRDIGDTIQSVDKLARLPASFQLPPKSYILRARAHGYDTAVARPPIELYGPTKLDLELQPETQAPVAAPRRPPARRTSTSRRPRKAELIVVAPDRLATLEITDATGAIIETGEGRVEATNLRSGLYRARLRTPEGAVDERMVELEAGQKEEVSVAGVTAEERTPTVERIVKSSGFERHGDGTLEVSELAGPIASAGLATILALAAGFQARRDHSHGRRLRSLGLTLFEKGIPRNAKAGIYVVFGTETETGAAAARAVKRVELKLWRVGKPVPRAGSHLTAAGTPGLGEFAKVVPPGPYWLSVKLGRGRPLVLSLAILPHRAAIVVLHRGEDGILGVYQYLPAIRPDPSSDPDAIRRIELLQRIYQSGRLDLGHDTARQLLNSKLTDPLAGALGGYLFLRTGHVAQLGRAVSNMQRFYPELSDSHVLRAEFEASHGRQSAAREATRKAVAAGVPIFSEGLSRLLDAVEAYRVTDDKARLLSWVYEESVRGSLWTLWRPQRLAVGKLLVP